MNNPARYLETKVLLPGGGLLLYKDISCIELNIRSSFASRVNDRVESEVCVTAPINIWDYCVCWIWTGKSNLSENESLAASLCSPLEE
jgi:hypothetical protein